MVQLICCLIVSFTSTLLAGGIGLFAHHLIGISSSILLGIGLTSASIAYLALYTEGQSVISLFCLLIYSTGLWSWYNFLYKLMQERKEFVRKISLFLAAGMSLILLVALPLIPLFDAILTSAEASPEFNPGTLFTIAQHLYMDFPMDNIIPATFAKAALKDTYTSPLIGDWLGSDRPPLQSGLIIFSAITTGPLGFDWDESSFAASIVANSLWILGALTFVSNLQFKQSLKYASLLPAGLSGYIILNTTFTWPKALAAGFLLASIASVCTNQKPHHSLARNCLAGLFLGLACLSHGSSFFAVPAIIVGSLFNKSRNIKIISLQSLKTTVLLLTAFASVQVPWIFWQKFMDPPGDRLLKWHLAGAIDITPESFAHVLIAQYKSIGISGIIQNKISNFQRLAGAENGLTSWQNILAGQYASAIKSEFFFHCTAILTWMLPTTLFVLALLILNRKMLDISNLSIRSILISFSIFVATSVFWCLAMFGPSTTVNHQGTGLTIIMPLLIAGVTFSNMNFQLFLAGCFIQAIGIFAIYTNEISNSARLAFAFCEILIICSSTLINISTSKKGSKRAKHQFL